MDHAADQEIINRIKEGDMGAFSILMDRYQRPVYSFIYHMVPVKAEADDIFQEVFLKVIAALKKYRHQDKHGHHERHDPRHFTAFELIAHQRDRDNARSRSSETLQKSA